jgi:uncharacterized membrane protein HdeD (DUF308 family)
LPKRLQTLNKWANMTVVIYGLLPFLIGIFCLFFSFYKAVRIATFSHWILTGTITVCMGLASFLFYRIFIVGAWPSYAPHILVLISGLILVFQEYVYLKRGSGKK